MKNFLVACFSTLVCLNSLAQDLTLDMPESDKSYDKRRVDGYYHQGLNRIVINEKLEDGIAHFLYDTSFNLITQYKRTFTEAELFYTRKPLRFAKEISFGDGFWEAYVCDTAVAIRQLDFENRMDTQLAVINFKEGYKNADLVAIIPQHNACSFLVLSGKKKKTLTLYRWQKGNSSFEKIDYELPKYTLSASELKQYDKFLSLDYEECFKQMSVSQCNQPDLFQMPSQSQLFYNDSVIYIINKTPYSTGINILSINFLTKQLRSSNYFLNEMNRNAMGTNLEKHALATIYRNTLIIENCSDKQFEYHFFNIHSGELIRSYKVPVKDSLDILVHSAYHQLGTFGSASEEKDLKKGKLFIRRKNNGLQFIKPLIAGDSMVLTFGSFIPTAGVGGLLLTAATASLGFAANIYVGNTQFIPYLTANQRNKFVYAHSKFAMDGWEPSTATNTTTILDQLIEDDKFKVSLKDNTILICLQDKVYLGVYDNKIAKYVVSKFFQ
jgi:hypothetical protein